MSPIHRPAAVAATSLLLLALAAGCGSGTDAVEQQDAPAATTDEAATAAALETARGAAAALGQKLKARLEEALRDPDPATALNACADDAQGLTAQVVSRQGVSVRRTALGLRNPANAPDAWERAWLEQATAAISGGAQTVPEHSEVLALEGGGRELRYLEPIYLMPLCTKCHGLDEEIPARVHDALGTRYPQDSATGYLVGDLRGAFSVRVPLD